MHRTETAVHPLFNIVVVPLFLIFPIVLSLLFSNDLHADAYTFLSSIQITRPGTWQPATAMPARFSAPLFTLLLGFSEWLAIPLHHTASLISGLGWSLSAIALFKLRSTEARPELALFPPILLIFNPLIYTTLGVAGSVVVGLAWLTVAAATNNNKWGQTACLVLLLLAQFEPAVILLVVLLWASLMNKPLITATTTLLIVMLLWGAAIWWQELPFGPLFLGSSGWGKTTYGHILFPLITIGLCLRLWKSKRFESVDLLLGWPLVAILFNPVTAEIGAAVAAAFLVGWSLNQFTSLLHDKGLTQLPANQLTTRLLLLIGLPLITLEVIADWQWIQHRPQAHHQAEQQAAAWLYENSPDSAVIAASPRLGYYANRPTVLFNQPTNTSALPSLLNTLMPAQESIDYFITDQTLGWQYISQTGWFQENFTPVHQVHQPNDTSSPLIIWQKSSSPLDGVASDPILIKTENGLDLVSYRVTPREIKPGDAVFVELEWIVQRPLTETVQTIVRLSSPLDQVSWAQRDMPTPRSLPSDWLEPGIRFGETFVLSTTLEIPVGAYLLTTSLHNAAESELRMMFQGEDPNPLDRATLGYVVVPWSGPIPEAATAINATFGEQVKLLSCACTHKATAGSTIDFTLYWEAARPPDENYVAFIHLLDGTGQYVTGLDATPLDGRYDMRAWQPGHLIPDQRLLTLPADLPPGEYALQVGLYQRENGTRLSAVDSQGRLNNSQTIALPPLIVEVE